MGSGIMDRTEGRELLEEVMEIRKSVIEEGDRLYDRWNRTPIRAAYENSARNLAYYMAFRKKDMRDLQERLIPWGVSSLGRLEADVLGSLNALTKTLGYITDTDVGDIDYRSSSSFEERNEKLQNNADEIFGGIQGDRLTRVLVTMPSAAGSDYNLVRDLMEAGMNMARINCAHDDFEVWQNMIDNIKKAEQETGRPCRVLMDISGPKIRTKMLLTTKKNPKISEGERFLISNQTSMTLPKGIEIAVNISVPEVMDNMQKGQQVKLDDGHIEAEAVEIRDDGVIC